VIIVMAMEISVSTTLCAEDVYVCRIVQGLCMHICSREKSLIGRKF
jgi:hypothetical protein